MCHHRLEAPWVGVSGLTLLPVWPTLHVQQVSGDPVRMSWSIPANGEPLSLTQGRAVSLGLAGVSHAAACACASEALAVPLQADWHLWGLFVQGETLFDLHLLISRGANSAPPASCMLWHPPTTASTSPGSLCFGDPLEPQTGLQTPQCGAEGHGPPLTCCPLSVKLKKGMFPPDWIQVTSSQHAKKNLPRGKLCTGMGLSTCAEPLSSEPCHLHSVQAAGAKPGDFYSSSHVVFCWTQRCCSHIAAALFPAQPVDPVLQALFFFYSHTPYLSFTSYDLGSAISKSSGSCVLLWCWPRRRAQVSFSSWIFSVFPIGAALAFQASLKEEKKR